MGRTLGHQPCCSLVAWNPVPWGAGPEGQWSPNLWAHLQLFQKRSRPVVLLQTRWKHEKMRGIGASGHCWSNSFGMLCSAYREGCRGCQLAHTDLPVRGPLVPIAGTDLPKAGPASDWITSWVSVSSGAHKPKTGHGVWVRVCGFPHGLWCSHGCFAIWFTTYPEIGYTEKRKRLIIIFHLWSDFYVLQLYIPEWARMSNGEIFMKNVIILNRVFMDRWSISDHIDRWIDIYGKNDRYYRETEYR